MQTQPFVDSRGEDGPVLTDLDICILQCAFLVNPNVFAAADVSIVSGFVDWYLKEEKCANSFR